MRILLVGGGSGGHVTPLKAIASQIPNDKNHSLRVITNRGFASETRQLFSQMPEVTVKAIFAGKFRRYHSKSFAWHILHLPTLLKNIRDIAYVAMGTLQSVVHIIVWRPDVVFCKGGFVCIPVGVAARLLRKRIVIHDSDTRPGLTNKLLSKWASVIATGMPTSFYPYPEAKMVYTGMPVDARYSVVTQKQQMAYKQELGFDASQKVLLVTGGGNGSTPLNKIVLDAVGELLGRGWAVIHLAGRGKAAPVLRAREKLDDRLQSKWQIDEFADMAPRMLAADIVIARTSASTLQECANAQKLVLGVPSPHLDDQNMNADYFASKEAIIALDETQLTGDELAGRVATAYGDAGSQKMAKVLHDQFAKPKAAAQLAAILLNQQ